ncbi:MAG: O-antigen ligase family protein [Oscillospiraceae bacterium]
MNILKNNVKWKNDIVEYGFLLLLLFYNSTYTVFQHIFSNYKSLLGVVGYILFGLAAASLIIRIRRVPRMVWVIIWMLLAAIIYSCIYSENLIHLRIIFSFPNVRKIWIVMLLFSVVNDPRKMLDYLRFISYPIILVNIYGVFSGAYSDALTGRYIYYMGFSYGILIWVTINIQHIFVDAGSVVNKICNSIFAVFICFILAFYGSRGAVLSLMIFVIFCFLKYFSGKRKITIISILSVAAIVIYQFWDLILGGLVSVTEKIGINSRNLYLLQESLLKSDTHRSNTVYKYCMELIRSHPLVGRGIGADRVVGGGVDFYAHNLMLELCADFGVLIGAAIFIWILWMGYKMLIRCEDRSWVKLYSPFFVTSFVHLMFSSSLYLVYEFWIAIAVYYACRTQLRKEGKDS